MGKAIYAMKYMHGGIKLYWHELWSGCITHEWWSNSKLRRWPQVSISHLNRTICHQILLHFRRNVISKNCRDFLNGLQLQNLTNEDWRTNMCAIQLNSSKLEIIKSSSINQDVHHRCGYFIKHIWGVGTARIGCYKVIVLVSLCKP